jgi:hypothetical protein
VIIWDRSKRKTQETLRQSIKLHFISSIHALRFLDDNIQIAKVPIDIVARARVFMSLLLRGDDDILSKYEEHETEQAFIRVRYPPSFVQNSD